MDTFVTIIIKRIATRYFQTEKFIKGILIINIRCRVAMYELYLLWLVMSHSFQNSSTNTFRNKNPISESVELFVTFVIMFYRTCQINGTYRYGIFFGR
jgi:flagellar basal body-associated protein FliL